MPLHQQWSDRNELLNALGHAIEDGTHGLMRYLSLDQIDDECVLVRGVADSYYGLQLALYTTQQFAAKNPLCPETRLVVHVYGSTLELVVLQPEHLEAYGSPSTHDAERPPRLTVAAPA